MYKGEWFNSISHLIGAVLSIIGLVLLVVLAARQGDPWKIVSFSIYGTALFLLYAFSTLYHSLKGKTKNVFHKLDHLAICLLIAGTYTPFSLITLRGNLYFHGLANNDSIQASVAESGANWIYRAPDRWGLLYRRCDFLRSG